MPAARNLRASLGLPLWGVVALPLLAVPRVVLHDLGMLSGVGAALLALGPCVVWIAVVLSPRVPSPLRTLLVVGAGYGVVLAVVHNLTWAHAFDQVPRLGGNLRGVLPPGVNELLLRTATSVSSLFTGLLVGLVCGLVATGLRALLRSSRSGADK